MMIALAALLLTLVCVGICVVLSHKRLNAMLSKLNTMEIEHNRRMAEMSRLFLLHYHDYHFDGGVLYIEKPTIEEKENGNRNQ